MEASQHTESLGAQSDATPRASTKEQVYEIAFESYGVTLGVCADRVDLMPRLRELVPPVHRQSEHDAVEHRLLLSTVDPTHYAVAYTLRQGQEVSTGNIDAAILSAVDLELALAMLGAHVHGCVARFAPDHVFVNAAVVEHGGSAIVLPGRGMSGRTTLANALVEAGATPYSEMFAAVDRSGRVHPYLTESPELAQDSGEGLPVGAVVLTQYVPGAQWAPQRLSRGEATIELLTHTVPAQESPEHAMRGVVSMLAGNPAVLRGDRGEAADVAAQLLADIEGARAGDAP